jgi:hypothetical protein
LHETTTTTNTHNKTKHHYQHNTTLSCLLLRLMDFVLSVYFTILETLKFCFIFGCVACLLQFLVLFVLSLLWLVVPLPGKTIHQKTRQDTKTQFKNHTIVLSPFFSFLCLCTSAILENVEFCWLCLRCYLVVFYVFCLSPTFSCLVFVVPYHVFVSSCLVLSFVHFRLVWNRFAWSGTVM